jgi:hypothetical protein
MRKSAQQDSHKDMSDGVSSGKREDPALLEGVMRRGVFISHASEDAPLAKAFSELIQDVSSGMVPSYSSSSTEDEVGIPYGKDWFDWIEEKIKCAGNVVALITPTSVDRPWILFEAGFGRAVENVRVFGLRLGTTGEEAYVGPFKALMNSGSEEDELLKLCRQLLEGTQCKPRDEKVRDFVGEFAEKVQEHFKALNETPKQANPESEAIFRALEVMKGLAQMPRGYADDWDDMRMMELDHLMHIALRPGREVNTVLRVTLLLGVATEIGLGWIAPTIQQALREPIDLGALEKIMIGSDVSLRRLRRTQFPPDMVIHELIHSVRAYQKQRFGSRLKVRKVAEAEQDSGI